MSDEVRSIDTGQLPEGAKVFVAGHRGLVGSAIARLLRESGNYDVIVADRRQLDLTHPRQVQEYFESERPSHVFLAAAKVGGILANDTYPADFIRDNLMIQTNVIEHAYRSGVEKLLFLGSSCIYPKLSPQPIKEEYFLTGLLEPTNQWYAIAKIAGIKMCQAYRKQFGFDAISLMPTNLYGPGDNFDLKDSHVLPAFIRKFHEASIRDEPTVSVWGSGKPRREFLFVEDMADAAIYLMRHYSSEEIINVGTGEDISIAELANLVKTIVGYSGDIVYDSSQPDGTPRKLLDISRLSEAGWRARTTLESGIEATYRWYREHEQDSRR